MLGRTYVLRNTHIKLQNLALPAQGAGAPRGRGGSISVLLFYITLVSSLNLNRLGAKVR